MRWIRSVLSIIVLGSAIFYAFLPISAIASIDSLLTTSKNLVISEPAKEQKLKDIASSTLSGTIQLNGPTIPDSFYMGLMPLETKWRLLTVKPKNMKPISDRDFTLDVEPGLYTLVISAFGYKTLKTSILIPDSKENVQILASLEPISLNTGIQWVKLWGDFCRWRTNGAIDMVQRDSVWVLRGENPVKIGEQYRFIVDKNNSEIYDLRHQNAELDQRDILAFNSIYKGGEIIFDPSLYVQFQKESKATFPNNKNQASFAKLIQETQIIDKEVFFSRPRKIRKNIDTWVSTFNELNENFVETEKKYPPYFEQFFLQKRFDFLREFHPDNKVMDELRKMRGKEGEEKRGAHYQSVTYESYFGQMATLVKKMDPNSIFFRIPDISTLLLLDEGLYFAPDLGQKYDIPPFYFTSILIAYERGLPPENSEGEILLWQMAQHYRQFGHLSAAHSTIEHLIRKYPNSKTVLKGLAEKMLNALKMQEESLAPDFAVKTIRGDWLKLSELRGKFVMLDFWATWCGPCVREIPNLKKLHEAFSQSELIIVGLAHDNPMDLDDFVKENSIPYFTAISDPAIEKAYGIVAWPTTFLIDPSGKIIGKNLRGENLVDLIEHKLTQYKSQ